jgi:hypothetical protein
MISRDVGSGDVMWLEEKLGEDGRNEGYGISFLSLSSVGVFEVL